VDGVSARKKLAVGNDELFLRDVVQPLLLQDEVVAEAVVENSKARAQHGLWRFLAASIKAPGNTDARRIIAWSPMLF